MNPYLVLGLGEDASDTQIREAYIAGVKKHPPESDPARFQEISSAYELIKGPAERRDWLLGNESSITSPISAVIEFAKGSPKIPPMDFNGMKDLLRKAAKGK